MKKISELIHTYCIIEIYDLFAINIYVHYMTEFTNHILSAHPFFESEMHNLTFGQE